MNTSATGSGTFWSAPGVVLLLCTAHVWRMQYQAKRSMFEPATLFSVTISDHRPSSPARFDPYLPFVALFNSCGPGIAAICSACAYWRKCSITSSGRRLIPFYIPALVAGWRCQASFT
jgi:hypothetical protein